MGTIKTGDNTYIMVEEATGEKVFVVRYTGDKECICGNPATFKVKYNYDSLYLCDTCGPGQELPDDL